MTRRACFFLLSLSVVFSAISAQGRPGNVVYLSFEAAWPVFHALEENVPAAASWPQWVAQRDKDIRARLRHGDETSLVNLVLFGTSFTKQSRITPPVSDPASEDRMRQILDARLNDFVRALATPGNNERLMFARRLLEQELHVKQFLMSALERRLEEEEGYARIVRDARALNDASLEFAARSSLYRSRGLSSDTSLRTNLSVEDALEQLQEKGILKSRITRVALVGPGLDFTDKQGGHDFYRPQTIQPFALMDSLSRLRLAHASDLQMTTFDLSLRVNDHIERLKNSAARGSQYVLQLPLDAQVPWTARLLSYWKKFGGEVGTPATPAAIPAAAGDVKIRAVRVRPELASKLTPVDLNIVLQHVELEESEKYDLIVGTNVFVYYDRLEQGLAMMNIAKMLTPGGLLLSNNALLELPSTRLKSVGYSITVYSDRQEDGDTMVWYRHLP